MGQNQTNPFKEGGQLMSEYRIDSRDLQNSQTYLTHLRTDKQFLLKDFTFNEIRQFSITSDKLKNRKILNSNHLTTLKILEQRTQDQMCSNFYKIYTLWDYPHRTLQQDLRLRNSLNKHYSNKQLFDIISSSIKGLKALQQQQIKHQCLSTKSILLQKQGLIKVADPLSGNFVNNIDTLFNNRSTKGIYLSPQQCLSLQQQKAIIDKNAFKNDVFTFGVIILQCGLLNSQQDCYLEGFSKINWNQLNFNINAFAKSYDVRLKNLVEYMLKKDIKARPDWLGLDKLIQSQPNYSSGNNFSNLSNDHNLPSPLTTIKSVQSQNAKTYSSFRSNQTQIIQPAYNINLIVQPQPVIGTQRTVQTVQTERTANFAPVQIFPTLQQRPVQITPTLAKSPMKQISFNIKSPNSNFNSNSISIVSPQPKRSAVCANIPPAQHEKPLLIAKTTQTYNRQNRNTLINHFDATFGFQAMKQPVQLQFVPNQQIKLQPCFSIQKQQFQEQKVINQPKSVSQKRNQQQQPQFVEEFFKLGSRYQGYKFNGMRQGKGKFYYQDGGSYDGDWKKNKMNGQGTLYYQSNKKAYEGEWVEDQFHGQGTLYNENPVVLNQGFDFRNFDEIQEFWVYYKGEFKADAKYGYGVLRFSNGEQFRGIFKEDMVEGEGYFFTARNVTIHGIWSQNHLVQLLN